MDITDYLDLYGLGELASQVDGLFSDWNLSFYRLLQEVLQGNIKSGLNELWHGVLLGVKGSISSYWELFLLLLTLGIIASFYQIFAASFHNHQIADTGYYIFYVAMMGILIKAFVSMQSIAVEFLNQMVLFIRLCIPAFCLCVGTATGGATATATYGSALFFLFLVEKVLRSIFLPALEVYILLSVTNGLWEEERLNTLLDQMESLLRGGMKWMLGGVCGITFVRNAIQPTMDSLAGSAFQKMAASIPLLGNVADIAWQTTVGAAVLVKNGVGIVMVILLFLLGVVPLCMIGVFALLLKADAILLGLFQDNRSVHCMERMGEGGVLLFQLLLSAMTVFFLFIALTVMLTV